MYIHTLILAILLVIVGLLNIKDSISYKSIDQSSNLSKLELVIVMNHKFTDWWEAGLKPSYELFWPKRYRRIKIITEFDQLENENFIKKSNSTSYITVTPEIPTNKSWTGHTKQQWDMFNADFYSNSEYIGFIDTDAVFITPVVESFIFEDNKPIVKGAKGNPMKNTRWAVWGKVPSNTIKAIGKPEVANFMTYFPVVIKREHFLPMREHIKRHMNKSSFLEAFDEIQKTTYSQFCIMMNYLFWFHRHEYVWSILEIKGGVSTKKPEGQVSDEFLHKILTVKELEPRLHVTTHWKYTRGRIIDKHRLIEDMQTGFCWATNFSNSSKCAGFKANAYQELLFIFQRNNEINCYEKEFGSKKIYNCPEMMNNHLASIDAFEWDLSTLESVFKPN